MLLLSENLQQVGREIITHYKYSYKIIHIIVIVELCDPELKTKRAG